MKRLLKDCALMAIGTAVILCCGTFSATAQEVKLTRGAPSARSIPQLGKLASVQPKPLSSAQKLQAVQSVVNRRGKRAGSFVSPLLLTPGKLTAGPASVRINYSTFVGVSDGVPRAAFLLNPGGVVVRFTPPESGFYILDYTIAGGGPFVFWGSSEITSTTNASQSNHLLFVTDNIQANKPVELALESSQMWIFYSCEISRIE